VDQAGDVRTLIHSQVSSILQKNRNAVATDRDGSEIRNDDTVKEYGGEQRQGRVMYIHRGVLFVHNRETVENAGIFVVRSNNVITMAAKSGRAQSGPDLGKMNPQAMQGPGANGGAMPPPRKNDREDGHYPQGTVQGLARYCQGYYERRSSYRASYEEQANLSQKGVP
jgi:transcription elongation factor SPT5